MKRFIRTVMLFLACACMSAPTAMADRHPGANRQQIRNERPSGSRGGNSSRPSSTSGRPGFGGNHNNGNNNNRPGNGGNNRPGNNGNHNGGNRPGNGNNNRPGNNGNHNGGNRPGSGRPRFAGNNNRPGNNGNHNGGNRPGNNNHRPDRPGNNGNHNGGNRPGNNNHRPDRPGNNHRPGGGNAWGGGNHRPGPRPPMLQPPHRPYRPVFGRPHYRPTPPPSWRPRRGIPVIRGILGLSFGSAIGISLDYIYNNGYVVDGYTNDIVYLRNVPALNYMWTDGALYYGPSGLDVSSFYYSTPGYDLARYNNCYNALVSSYGVPVSVNNAGGSMSATWFGGQGGYITLSFGSGTAGRFLTTLTFGL